MVEVLCIYSVKLEVVNGRKTYRKANHSMAFKHIL